MTRRIVRRYRRYFRNGCWAMQERRGEFFAIVQHHGFTDGPQLAVVKFDGNKLTSRVPLVELFEDDE